VRTTPAFRAGFALLLSFIPSILLAFNAKQPFDISADMIDYLDADQAISAEGHVVVIQGTSTLKADSMRYERANQRLLARGHVIATDKGATLIGESMEYDLLQESGTVVGAMGYQSPWIFSGATWEKQLDYFSGHDVSFTSCDLADPHYHVRSRSVHLVPDNYFWAWNNVAYADTVPVFYSPFLYKSLEKRRIVVRFEPGHDTVNGNFVKTLTTLRLTDEIYDKVLFDYYSDQGNGIGNEFNYRRNDMQGSLFGYYIDPKGNPALAGAPEAEQYNIRSYHWQRLTSALTLQSNVNLRKNISFNNQYFPQDINQSVNDITSSIALTHQKKKINQRLVVERLDAPDPGDTSQFAETHIQSASLPRYDFTLYQTPLWSPASSTDTLRSRQKLGPLLFNANAALRNTYRRTDEQFQRAGDGSFTLSEAMPFSRDVSFTPTVTPRLHWQDRFDAQTPAPVGSTATVSNVGQFRGFQGRVGTADTLRWRPASALTFDQTYSLVARMEPNGTSLDRGPSDGGIETHRLGGLVFWRPNRRILMRSFSGYDLRKIADETEALYNQRKWDPWTSELTYSPSLRHDFFGRYGLGFYPYRSQLWEADYRYYGDYHTVVQTGLLYNRGTPGLMTWNNTLGFYVSPGWRVDGTIHTQVNNDSLSAALHQSHFIDETIMVTRDMHCWEAQFIYRNIPPLSRQYSLMFNLKLGVQAEREITNQELESQYYPWRARPYAP
jgi:hypothetical protein